MIILSRRGVEACLEQVGPADDRLLKLTIRDNASEDAYSRMDERINKMRVRGARIWEVSRGDDDDWTTEEYHFDIRQEEKIKRLLERLYPPQAGYYRGDENVDIIEE